MGKKITCLFLLLDKRTGILDKSHDFTYYICVLMYDYIYVLFVCRG